MVALEGTETDNKDNAGSHDVRGNTHSIRATFAVVFSALHHGESDLSSVPFGRGICLI